MLKRDTQLLLMLVVASAGSSPGKPGAKMALASNGESCGTIGGGGVEDRLMQQGLDMLLSHAAQPRLCRELLHPTDSQGTPQMTCGGEQTVLLYPCAEQHLPCFEQILANYATRRATLLEINAASFKVHAPATSPQAQGEGNISEFVPNVEVAFTDGEDWRYCERLGARNSAYIIGGGHVSLALSQILAMLDFDITVIDSRPDLPTMLKNHYARQKLIVPYHGLAALVPEGSRQFIFVMTHGHQYDEQVVAQLAAKQVRYLGVLGSHGKIARLKANLQNRIAAERLQALHAPMGLPIGSHSPAEIAVSIAAEVVQLLNVSAACCDDYKC